MFEQKNFRAAEKERYIFFFGNSNAVNLFKLSIVKHSMQKDKDEKTCTRYFYSNFIRYEQIKMEIMSDVAFITPSKIESCIIHNECYDLISYGCVVQLKDVCNNLFFLNTLKHWQTPFFRAFIYSFKV